MSGRIHSLKRRDPDDLLLDLQNVSLSPSKRLRLNEQGAPVFTGLGSALTTPQSTGETPFSLLKGLSAPALTASTPSTPVDVMLSPPPPQPPSPPVSVPATESRAIVLYRPVNPPLFPGGPPCGSMDLPISLKMHSSMLPRPQALDLSGRLSLPVEQRRLTRNSSCPRLSSGMEDQLMTEDIDEKAAQHLQVIPWVPNVTTAFLTNTKPTTQETYEGTGRTMDAEEMVEDESMEVVSDGVVAPELDAANVGSQFGSPLATFGSSPWPQYETFQPQFPRAMWSH
ncbi:hypothetical protein R1flu_019695 [Riccia fluitans]|uniref:Uncharacterized protein n=1 Tax=Riccia fluitans TaxID=41844 RepID=A0ABD1ZJT1_9MARC